MQGNLQNFFLTGRLKVLQFLVIMIRFAEIVLMFIRRG